MIDQSKIDHAIVSHSDWKFRLRKAIDTGKSDSTVEAVRASDRCEFGRWLHDLPPADRLSEHAREAIRLHSEFHAQAAHVLELALAGRKQEALAAMGFGSNFADTSAQLTDAMLTWQKDLTATGLS